MSKVIYLRLYLMLFIVTLLWGCSGPFQFEFEIAELNRAINVLEKAPSQWRTEIESVTETISENSTKVSGAVKQDVLTVVDQVEQSTKGVEVFTGSLVMCSTDFFGTRVKENLEQIRDSLQNKVNHSLGKPSVPLNPVKAAICVYTPSDQVDVTLELVAKQSIVKVHGYNFTASNLPRVDILAGDIVVQQISSSAVSVSSPYLMQINLAGIIFPSSATRVMLTWENLTSEPRGLPLKFEPTPTPIPQPTPVPEPQKKTIDVAVQDYAKPADWGLGGGECKSINYPYTVEDGWEIDQSQGDDGHAGIQLVDDNNNRQARDTLRGHNYQAESYNVVRVSVTQFCGGGFHGPGAVFDRTYRVFLVENR